MDRCAPPSDYSYIQPPIVRNALAMLEMTPQDA